MNPLVQLLLSAASTMAGWPYGAPAHRPRRPLDPKQIDCCTFVEEVMRGIWTRPPLLPPAWRLSQHWRAMAGTEKEPDPWGPVEVYCAAQMATAAPLFGADSFPALLQGWDLPEDMPDDELKKAIIAKEAHGHSLFVLGHDPATRRLLTLESRRGLGPCHRGFGPVVSAAAALAGWESNPALPTTADFHVKWGRMKMARILPPPGI